MFLKRCPLLRIGEVSVGDPAHVFLIADIILRGNVFVLDGSIFDQDESVNIIVLLKIPLIVALEHKAVVQELPVQEHPDRDAPLNGNRAVFNKTGGKRVREVAFQHNGVGAYAFVEGRLKGIAAAVFLSGSNRETFVSFRSGGVAL